MQALLLIDMQNDYFPGGLFPLRNIKKAARNAAYLLEEYRQKGWPVIYIRHISQATGRFFLPDTFGSEIHDGVKPRDGEKVIIKNYPNSFRETGLRDYLKELGIKDLHIAGAMTNMCIDSTVRAAFDLGYTVYLHEKACAARGVMGLPLVHLISIKTLGSVFAKIV
jgi:nicotinamidase-related amidase